VTLKLRNVNKFISLHCAVVFMKRRAALIVRKPATFNQRIVSSSLLMLTRERREILTAQIEVNVVSMCCC